MKNPTDNSVITLLCSPDNGLQAIRDLFIAGIIKLILMIFTIGLRIPAGIIIPSIALGALFGRATGMAVQIMHDTFRDFPFFVACARQSDCINPGVYAVVGAAATLGGITRMSVSLAVIMFELTGGLQFIVPIMASVLFSKWVGDAFGSDSIYEASIKMNALPFLDPKIEKTTINSVNDVLHNKGLDFFTLKGNTVGSLQNEIYNVIHNGYPIVTNKNEMLLTGYITRRSLQNALDNALTSPLTAPETPVHFSPESAEPGSFDLAPYLDPTPVQVMKSTKFDILLEMFRKLGLRYVLIVHSGRLIGIITKKDMISITTINH